jgi:hypothetical protein
MGNYQQSDFRIPTTDPKVTVMPHPLGHPSGNPMALNSAALVDFIQPGTAANGAELLKPVTWLAGPMGISNNPAGGH